MEERGLEEFLALGKHLRLGGLAEDGFKIKQTEVETQMEDTEDITLVEETIFKEDLSDIQEVEPMISDPFEDGNETKIVPNIETTEPLHCQICKASFKTKSDLNSHIVSCRVNQNLAEIGPELIPSLSTKYSCELCGFTVLFKASMNKHKFDKHGGNQCDKCAYKAHALQDMHQHILASHTDNSFGCSDCGKMFKSEHLLKHHKKSLHSPDIVFCPRCKSKFKNQDHLDIHLPLCTIFPCDLCEYGAQSEGGLKQHKEFKHEGIRYNCEICDYQTGFQGQLTTHMMTRHKNRKEANYGCDQCPTKCVTESGLQMHKRAIHTGENKTNGQVDLIGNTTVVRYQCDSCEYKATTNGNLMMHKKRKHG